MKRQLEQFNSVFDVVAQMDRDKRIKTRDVDRDRILSQYQNKIKDKNARMVNGIEMSENEILFRNGWNWNGTI